MLIDFQNFLAVRHSSEFDCGPLFQGSTNHNSTNHNPKPNHTGWNVTSAGWQVTLCDPIWHVSSSSGVATSVSELLYQCYFTLLYILTLTLSLTPTFGIVGQYRKFLTKSSIKIPPHLNRVATLPCEI